MTDIIKVYYLTDYNTVKNITVYMGSSRYQDNMSELFKENQSNEVFKDVFSEDEIKSIETNSIPIIFTEQIIYSDDTIESIKKKTIIANNKEISFDEIYLFTKQIQTLDNSQIYDNLTQNGKIVLSKDILLQFLSNISDYDVSEIPEKELYSFNDIIDLNLSNSPHILNISLGQHFITSNDIYSYTVNPYSVTTLSKHLSDHAENIITTSNKELLLNSGFLFENTIYMTSAEDVLKYAVSKNIPEKTMTQIYFPFLKEKKIFNIKDLNDEKFPLLESNRDLVNDSFTHNVQNIELFHDIYNSRKSRLDYIEQGIQMIEFTISQNYEYNLPLDIIFKLIHAVKSIPFIKFNPSKNKENIYRLYCDKVAKNGKKIPYLSKNLIFKLMKSMGISKRVSCYIEYQNDTGRNVPIILEFDNYANIYVKMEFKEANSISNIENMVRFAVNPTIEIVQKYLQNSGYNMKLFTDFYDRNIEILNLKYYAYISIEKNMDLNNIIGCVSSIFNVVVGDLKSGIVMRYKRVANFNEMDSQEAFIVEMLNNSATNENDVVKSLMDNFQMKEKDAKMKIAELLNNLQVIQNLNKNKGLKIKNNPGFLTKITQDKFKQNIMIEMNNINNIFYMNIIPIYLDSLIRITQNPEDAGVDVSTINSLCKTRISKNTEEINEIIAPSERPLGENIPTAIIAQDLVFGDAIENIKDKSVNVLDFLFDDDDDDDDDDGDGDDSEEFELEYTGGNDDSSESEGIDVELDEESDDDIVNSKNIKEPLEEGKISKTTPMFNNTIENTKENKKENKKEKLNIVDNFDNLKTNITGLKIADPNPFFQRMRERDPTLFLTESKGKYNAYSRVCPWNKRKQPVILTDSEKEKIDKDHPGSYDQAIKYGSDPTKQFWYICPRYWDLKNNTSLTKEEVDSGKYGGIIPQTAKTAPPGKNIWEFNDTEGAIPRYHLGKNGEYVKHYPGFLKKDVHPDGLCVPCCFSSWDKPVQKKRRQECMKDSDVDNNTDNNSKSTVAKKIDVYEYIKGPDKFPLEEGRFGYLPVSIQRFIQTDNKKCQVSNINTNLKKNQPCYLRKGVENNANKSFLACISDIYGEINNDDILSVDNLIKEKIIPLLNLDNFIKYQNGNLITSFKSKDTSSVNLQNEEYPTSSIYKTLIDKNPNQLKDIISAQVNFKEYISNVSSVVDYEYLWDLISDKNPSFFNNGLNLVIIELPQDDVTSNVNIICPTNFYSINKFDKAKDTVILLKKYEYFEPIYIVIDKSSTNVTKLVTTKLLTSKLMQKVPNLTELSNTIQDIYKSMCKPLASIPDMNSKYNFKEVKFVRNHTLEKVIEILNKYNIEIINMVVNYDNKVIGLNIQYNNENGFIPCFPSGIVTDYPIIIMDENTTSKNFEETTRFLFEIASVTENNILCKPVVKILEDELIVGILTQTNQFIEISEPQQDNDMTITYSINDENFYSVNKITQTSKSQDTQRIEYIRKIRIETELYNTFRNRLKKMFNQYENKIIRNQIETISNSQGMVYYLQLEKSIGLIKTLMKDEVEFIQTSKTILQKIEENLKRNTTLLIPKTNLLSNLDNESIYYSKIADELIRYKRIKQFMFEPNMFLSFNDIKYNLYGDELLILQSLLSPEYFENLVPDNKNKFITYNSYDTVEPNITQSYDNEYYIDNTKTTNKNAKTKATDNSVKKLTKKLKLVE